MTLGRNTIMRLSRQYAASKSAKKAVARDSWLVKVHHHSEWAVVKYHSGPPFGTAPTNHKLIPHELRTTNNEQQKSTSRRPTSPAESRTSLSGGIPLHHQVTKFGISDSHGFARRKAPLLTMHYVYITFQAGRPSGRPLRATSHELRTTKKALEFSSAFFTRISGFLSSQGASPQVLSAFAGLTAVFGMGTGGSPQLSPLNYIVQDVRILTTA